MIVQLGRRRATMLTWGMGLAMAALVAAGAARADVVDANPGGFQTHEQVEIAAPAAKVWAALGQFGAWWNGKHSWSGDAKNFNLDLKPGGYLTETLAGGTGGARHLAVIMAAPGKLGVLDG